MNKNNLKTALSHIKEFIKNSRPAYKDYLGEETVTIPGKVIATGTLTTKMANVTVTDSTFTNFIVEQTYQVMVGDVVGEYATQDCVSYDLGYCVGSFDFAQAESENVMPENYWFVTSYDGVAQAVSGGTYVGQTISISTLPSTMVEKKYDIKKLSEELLPDSVVKGTQTLTEAKSYSDTGDSTTLSEAKSYSDTGDSTTLSEAKSYSDTGDSTTLSEAKSYSDTGDSTTLSEAKSYSDTGDSTTLSEAKSYTDEQLAGLSQIQFITWEEDD